MAARVYAYYDHRLTPLADPASTIERLNDALQESIAVARYWESTGSEPQVLDPWTAEPVYHRFRSDLRAFVGPGGLRLSVMPQGALLGTAGRWRDFLMIEPLRRVHVAAFRALGQAIGATRLTVCDSMCDDLLTAFVEGAGTADCIALLHASMGPPQHSIEAIRPEFVKQAENRVPSIWFTEPLPTGPKNW